MKTQGDLLKEEALDSHESRHPTFVEYAREIAVLVAKEQGEVTADDVRERIYIPPFTHPSAMGAVFRGGAFECVGFTKSRRTEARGRVIRVYRLRGDA